MPPAAATVRYHNSPLLLPPQIPTSLPKQTEIEIGKELGEGGFCTVSEVAHVTLRDPLELDQATETSEHGADFIGLQDKKFITERHRREGEARYAIKKLTKGTFSKGPQHFVSGLIDLAMEVKFLAVLRHHHIIKMRAVANVPPTSEDFWIMIDRLVDTLDGKLDMWKKKNKKMLVKKAEKEEMVHQRLTVAYDICSALAFLHQHKIIYRDLVSDE